MSGFTEQYIKDKLIKGVEAELVEVTDQSDGCGGKFEVLVVSKLFEGKPLLARHRLVNSVLEEELKTIHAFSQKTLTPAQWKDKQT
jgi:stress-induced morphogen